MVWIGSTRLRRVSDYGSVKVDDLMHVERYSHVQHLETSLRSRLRDGLDRFDAFASCFPAGTVTGAPKIRAMEIIRGQLSGMYIQHEAIEAQKAMVGSPNHTVVYIPVGAMGVPVTGTFPATGVTAER